MRFGILGPLEVADDQGRELGLGGRKQRAVLAILLLRANEVVSSERLIDELWGERPPATAAKTVQVYVSNLRKALGEGLLLTRGGGYVLVTEGCELDVDRFQTLVAEGRQALTAGDPRVACGRLRAALGLWRGPPLAEFAYDLFAQATISRLEDARLATLEDRIDAELALGEHAAIVGELETLVHQHPLRERLRVQLMLALYRSGRHADALESYQIGRRTLVDELGIEPGRRLRELHQAILEQDPTLDLASRPDTSNLGRIASAAPTNLPPRTRALLGRDRELTELRDLLTGGVEPLVTLTGIGGSGKTLLAIAVGNELLELAPGGVFLVSLAATRDRESVLPMIAEAVGITGESEASLPRALARRLGEQRTVLILDNFEQLVHAASLVADLSRQAPALRVLATSQVPLRLSIERVFALGPLDRQDAVALFLERGRARDRRFEPTDEGLAAVERICALLDDTPLAIELAASRAQTLGPAALLERLSRPLSLLTRGDRDAPERQRSLRATIDWTFELLPPGQRQLFARFGACAGPVPLTAIEAIAGPEGGTTALDDLEALIEVSLVRCQRDRRLGPRFLTPQALRDYAGERLRESGAEQSSRRRHAEHVVMVISAGRLWKWGTTAQQRAALEALAQEIRPAVAWARAQDPALHVRLCSAAGLYWIYQGVISEAQDELRTAVDSGEGSPAEHAWVLTLLAKCLQLTGGASDAGRLSEQALDAWRSVTNDTERAIGLGLISWVYRWLLRRREGIELAEESLELLRDTHDRELILRGLVFLVHALVDDGQVDQAEPLLKEATTLSGGDPVYELDPIRGDIAELRGQDAEAARCYARSLAWASSTGESHQSLMDLQALASTLAKAGHGEAALEAAELYHIQEASTGRLGEHPEWARELERSIQLARGTAGEAASQAARARARALPTGQIAHRAVALVEAAVGNTGVTWSQADLTSGGVGDAAFGSDL